MDNFEIRYLINRERHQDFVAESAREALYYELMRQQGPLSRQVARYAGRISFRLGLALLRYGKADIEALLLSYQQLPELSRKH
jgi:hypothetical protein